jgi:branched-chain amino acid transport system ATP-binding protein
MSLLVLNNVTKRFGGLTAVDRTSFAIAAGELVALVGPNGAGKTTLFNLISGVLRPDAGSIFFAQRDITGLPPHRRAHLGLGRTFQIPRSFGRASVRENVAIGAMFGSRHRQTGVAEGLAVADHYLQRLGLAAKADAPASSLSLLESKLMGLARALAMRPKLLLLDETMAGMNPHEIDETVELLRRIRAQEQIAIVAMVEHIMRAVAGLAERVIVLHQGAVLADGPTQAVLADARVIDVYLGGATIDYA